MKIFLDDARDAPEGWMRAYWPNEVIDFLRTGSVTELSLDHDLGDDSRGTGYDVLNWLEETVVTDPSFVLPRVSIHTANPAARYRMEAAMDSIERIVKDRVAAAQRREKHLHCMQPALKDCLDELTATLLAEYGECVDRIVIIGSAVGDNFRIGESDVDIAVLMSDVKVAGNTYSRLYDFELELNEKFKGPWKKFAIAVKTSAHVHKVGTNLANCYEGSVMRGFIAYNKNPDQRHEVYCKEEALKYIVDNYAWQARLWINMVSTTSGRASWSVCRAACRALHAELAVKDVDFSTKEIRWNLPVLCEMAGLDVKNLVDQLPHDLAQIDIDDEEEYYDDCTISERRRLLAIGFLIVRKMEWHLGVNKDSKMRFRPRTVRSDNRLDWLQEKAEKSRGPSV